MIPSFRFRIAILPVVLGVILLILWNEWCRYKGPELLYYIPDTSRENLLKCQFFDDCDSLPEVLLLGSSMTAVIEPFLSSNFTGIGLNYSGPTTGLLLLEAKGEYPPIIGIEMNRLHLESMPQVINPVISSRSRLIRKLAPALAEYNDPLLTIGWLGSGIHWQNYAMRLAYTPPNDRTALIVQSWNDNHWNSFKDSTQLAHSLIELEPLVELLKAKGCLVFLYEIPPCDLSRSSRYHQSYLREVSYWAQRQSVPFVKAHDWLHMMTADGEHLQPNEAWLYAQWLEREALVIKKHRLN